MLAVAATSLIGGTSGLNCYVCGGKGERSCEEFEAAESQTSFEVDCSSVQMNPFLGGSIPPEVIAQMSKMGGGMTGPRPSSDDSIPPEVLAQLAKMGRGMTGPEPSSDDTMPPELFGQLFGLEGGMTGSKPPSDDFNLLKVFAEMGKTLEGLAGPKPSSDDSIPPEVLAQMAKMGGGMTRPKRSSDDAMPPELLAQLFGLEGDITDSSSPSDISGLLKELTELGKALEDLKGVLPSSDDSIPPEVSEQMAKMAGGMTGAEQLPAGSDPLETTKLLKEFNAVQHRFSICEKTRVRGRTVRRCNTSFSTEIIRGCEGTSCYCDTDLCNGKQMGPSGLLCHVCGGPDQLSCELFDPSNSTFEFDCPARFPRPSHVDSPESAIAAVIEASENMESFTHVPICQKTHVDGETVRGCLSAVNPRPVDNCTETSCYCHSEKCNSASNLHYTAGLFIMALLATVVNL